MKSYRRITEQLGEHTIVCKRECQFPERSDIPILPENVGCLPQRKTEDSCVREDRNPSVDQGHCLIQFLRRTMSISHVKSCSVPLLGCNEYDYRCRAGLKKAFAYKMGGEMFVLDQHPAAGPKGVMNHIPVNCGVARYYTLCWNRSEISKVRCLLC